MNKSFLLFKKSVKSIFVFTLTILTASFWTSCENFLNGAEINNQIKKIIDYQNANECIISLDYENEYGKIVKPAASEISKKVSDSFTLQFKPNADSVFDHWEAVNKEDASISMDEYVEFIETENEYTSNVKLLKESNSILIRPVCYKKLKVEKTNFNESEIYPRDSSIVITFNRNLKSTDVLNDIKITIPGIEDAKQYFIFDEPSVITENKIIIFANPDLLIPVTSGEKAVTVTVPESCYYEPVEEMKFYLEEDYVFTYYINITTSKKDKILFTVDGDEQGTLKVNNELSSYNAKEYSIGETVNLSFRNNDDYCMNGWKVIYTAEDETVTQLENPEDAGISIIYEDETDKNSAKLVVLNYTEGSFKITPDVQVIPSVDIKFVLDDSMSGVLKDNGVISNGAVTKYKKGSVITVTYKNNQDYLFEGWSGITSLLKTNYKELKPLETYDSDTKTSTITLEVTDGYTDDAERSKNVITIKPLSPKIQTLSITFEGEHGNITPSSGTHEYKTGQRIELNFDAVTDYCFTQWNVYINNTLAPEQEFIYFVESPKKSRTTIAINSFDEKELVKKSIKIVPATKERPHVISNTPVYESTGVYRDSKISVMFDKDISEGSIYWTLEELKKLSIVDSEGNTVEGYQLLKAADKKDENGNQYYYGYKFESAEDSVVFKNISIQEAGSNNNLNNFYGMPYIGGGNTLVIPSKKADENGNGPLPEGTFAVVSITGDIYYVDSLTQSKVTSNKLVKWSYKVNNDLDDKDPLINKIHFYKENNAVVENEIVSSSKEPKENDIFSVKYLKDRKLYSAMQIVDYDSGPKESITIIYTKIYDDHYIIKKDFERSQMKKTILNSEMGESCAYYGKTEELYGIDLSDFEDGIYEIYFNVQDLRGNSFLTDKYYFLLDNTVNIPQMKFEAKEKDKININIDFKDYDNDYVGGEIKYREKKSEKEYEVIPLDYRKEDYSLISTSAVTVQDGKTYEIVCTFYDMKNNFSTVNFVKSTLPVGITDLQGSIDGTTASLNWIKPENCENYDGIHIECVVGGSVNRTVCFTESDCESKVIDGSLREYCTITGLEKGKTYYFRAYSMAYDSDETVALESRPKSSSFSRTSDSYNTSPNKATVIGAETNGNTIDLAWKCDGNYEGATVLYGTDKDNLNKSITVPSSSKTCTLIGNIAETQYYSIVTKCKKAPDSTDFFFSEPVTGQKNTSPDKIKIVSAELNYSPGNIIITFEKPEKIAAENGYNGVYCEYYALNNSLERKPLSGKENITAEGSNVETISVDASSMGSGYTIYYELYTLDNEGNKSTAETGHHNNVPKDGTNNVILNLSARTSTSLKFTWNSPKNMAYENGYQGLRIYYRPHREDTYKIDTYQYVEFKGYSSNYTGTCSGTINGLKPNTTYDIRYYIIDEEGNSGYKSSNLSNITYSGGATTLSN